MNIVLTGATGFVDSEVLSQLLAHPAVERVTALVRRPSSRRAERLVEIVHDDFTRYDDALCARLADHAACVWALGGKAGDFADVAEYERVTYDYALAFAEAMARREGAFTYCYVSGLGADRAGTSALPWERATRRAKGRTERDLLALHRRRPGFAPLCFRPGGVLPRGERGVAERVFGRWVVRVDVLARALVRAALSPATVDASGDEEAVVTNAAIGRLGRAPFAEGRQTPT